jgi:hypothetical protein
MHVNDIDRPIFFNIRVIISVSKENSKCPDTTAGKLYSLAYQIHTILCSGS